MGFIRVKVNIFFDHLEKLMTKFKFPPSRIFNMDESGISTVPNTTPKVVSTQGKLEKLCPQRGGTLQQSFVQSVPVVTLCLQQLFMQGSESSMS